MSKNRSVLLAFIGGVLVAWAFSNIDVEIEDVDEDDEDDGEKFTEQDVIQSNLFDLGFYEGKNFVLDYHRKAHPECNSCPH